MATQADPFGPQMPLGISLAPGATFEAWFVGPNRFAVEVLRAMADGHGEQQAFVAAEAGLGKSHLLQATCRRAADAGARCAWLPLDGEAGADAGILEGLDALDLIALDALETVAGDDAWERALFGLINDARARGTRLIFAARAVPAGLALRLPDLASRLTWGPVLQLAPLEEAEKREALMARARVLGLELPDAVADYLLRHFPRDLAGQLQRLDTLDRASLASGRRLTVPFVKEVLARD
jgi:DnaA family protein